MPTLYRIFNSLQNLFCRINDTDKELNSLKTKRPRIVLGLLFNILIKYYFVVVLVEPSGASSLVGTTTGFVSEP